MNNDAQVIIEIAKTTYARALERMTGIASEADLAEFIKVANDVEQFDSYKVFSARAHSIVERISTQAGKTAVHSFLRGVIALAIISTLNSERFRKLPTRVVIQQLRQLRRIAEDSSDELEWLSLDKDLFQKDFGIASMRLYVAGAQLVEAHSGIPRSLIFRGGLGRVLPNLVSLLRLGGFRPYFQIHTHQFMLDAFNEAGWDECYLCCAELYALHPDVLGMLGSSWFYDPALDALSPRLRYLRDTPQGGGAHLFFYEKGGSAINNSLSTSPTRRKLYEEGKYMPTNYMLVWDKHSQIAWARRHLSAHPELQQTGT